MKIHFNILGFNFFHLQASKHSFALDILEYNEISLLTILINSKYKRVEILTFSINFKNN